MIETSDQLSDFLDHNKCRLLHKAYLLVRITDVYLVGRVLVIPIR